MISIIVPVFNVATFLPRCIESIISSSNNDWEMILINDGSTDNSGEICEQYASKDSRIIAIHQENGGVCSARNAGLEIAKGEWIVFVDADDYIDSQFLNLPADANVDLIVKSHRIVNEKDYLLKESSAKEQLLCTQVAIDNYTIYLRRLELWDKIIRKDVIQDMRFDQSVKIGEDSLFFLSICNNIHRIRFCEIGTYYYVKRQNSAMSKAGADPKKRIEGVITNIEKAKAILYKINKNDMEKKIICRTYIPFLLADPSLLTTTQKNILNQYTNAFTNIRYLTGKRNILNFIKYYMLHIFRN